MAHNIFGERFLQDRNAPAWHGLGINGINLTATAALEKLGSYDIELRPLSISLPDGSTVASPYRHIVRHPVSDDPIYRVFGQPVLNYELITPQDAVAMADANVLDRSGQPVNVSTFGILGKGDRLFISYELPKIDVAGDEVEMYMLYDNPMFSGKAAGVYTTGVRVVCQNTLTLGIQQAKQQKTITHLPGSKRLIAEWLGQIYSTALITVDLAREAYNILASKKATLENVRWIAEAVYPLPPQPDLDKIRTPLHEAMETWEKAVEQQQHIQTTVVNLFDGFGTGMNTKACNGTLFGAYNAVAEVETYRKTSNYASAAMDMVGGLRAARIAKAFNLSLELAKA